MKKIKYFSESWQYIETAINSWLRRNNDITVHKIHISREQFWEGALVVNAYIFYEEVEEK